MNDQRMLEILAGIEVDAQFRHIRQVNEPHQFDKWRPDMGFLSASLQACALRQRGERVRLYEVGSVRKGNAESQHAIQSHFAEPNTLEVLTAAKD